MADLNKRVGSLEIQTRLMQRNVEELTGQVNSLEVRVEELGRRVGTMDGSVREVKLHLENFTDRNISVLAENHLYLIGRMNESLRFADSSRALEVKVSVVADKMEKIEREFQQMMTRPA